MKSVQSLEALYAARIALASAQLRAERIRKAAQKRVATQFISDNLNGDVQGRAEQLAFEVGNYVYQLQQDELAGLRANQKKGRRARGK